MSFNPIIDELSMMTPPPTLPPANSGGSALNVLEIAPGLAVDIRFINGNWHLVPTSGPVDVEGMIVDRLAAKLQHPAEISYDEICCLLNALANRRDSLINAWRNSQGLLGTDKPLPLTEISPLAMVEDGDRIPNTLPTAESSGNEVFDFIEYSYTCYQKGVWDYPVSFGIIEFGHGWDLFRIGDRLKVQLFRMGTHEAASPKFEISLKHRLYRENQCWPEDQWMIYSRSYPGGPDSTGWFSQIARHGIGPEYEGSCGHLPSIWKTHCLEHPEREEICWPGDNSVALSIAVTREYGPGRFGPVQNNEFYIHIERVDKFLREYGINIVNNYYNHNIGDIVTETRSYSKYYRDKSLMEYVAAEEIKVLDQMRIDAMINGPQWIQGKSILEMMVQAGPICPPPEIPTSMEWPPPPIEIELPEIPQLPEPPTLPPIILPPRPPIPEPPPFIPPIFPPIFPKKLCEKDILEGRWV